MSVYWMLYLFVYLRGYWIWEPSAGDKVHVHVGVGISVCPALLKSS